MRWFFIAFTCAFSLYLNVNGRKIIELENKISELYFDGFCDYLFVDVNYNLVLDKDRLKKEINKYGEVSFCDGINFTVTSRFPFKYERKFKFLVEKNHG